MSAKTPTIYANVVTVRATSSELILDFGIALDPPESIQGPPEIDPGVRVILAADAIKKLAELLTNAAAIHQQGATKQRAAE